MSCTTNNITRGTDWTFTFTLSDSSGTVLDLTGYNFLFTAKANKTDADVDAVISKDSIVSSDPTSGVVSVALTDDDTDIAAGRYWYDLKWTDGLGLVSALPMQRLKIVENITDRIS